jgi:hypothetical protein
MTPCEIQAVIDGWEFRFEIQAELQAHFTAQIMNVWTKKKYKGRDLYRSRTNNRVREKTREERQRQFEEAVRLMGPEVYPVKFGRRGQAR